MQLSDPDLLLNLQIEKIHPFNMKGHVVQW
jgi:hypothetical protein